MIYTSYYAKRPPMKVVSVSLYSPRWIDCQQIIELAPQRGIFGLKDRDEFYKRYWDQLETLGSNHAQDLINIHNNDESGDLALCCYEALKDPEQWCHRIFLAEWLRSRCHMDVTEYGWDYERTTRMEVSNLRASFEYSNYRASKIRIAFLIKRHTELANTWSFNPDETRDKPPFFFNDGTPALKEGCGIVIGAHGPYVEFDESDALFDMYIPASETWRQDEKYSVKYDHLQPVARDEKVYRQRGTVAYADYSIGKYYIDLYSLNTSGN